MNLRLLELRLRFLAKQIAIENEVFDTGNFVNLITSSSSIYKITIYFGATYTQYLEEGTRYTQKHKGIISQKIVYGISRYLQDTFDNRKNSETLNINLLAKKTRVTPARQQRFLQSIVR